MIVSRGGMFCSQPGSDDADLSNWSGRPPLPGGGPPFGYPLPGPGPNPPLIAEPAAGGLCIGGPPLPPLGGGIPPPLSFP